MWPWHIFYLANEVFEKKNVNFHALRQTWVDSSPVSSLFPIVSLALSPYITYLASRGIWVSASARGWFINFRTQILLQYDWRELILWESIRELIFLYSETLHSLTVWLWISYLPKPHVIHLEKKNADDKSTYFIKMLRVSNDIINENCLPCIWHIVNVLQMLFIQQ